MNKLRCYVAAAAIMACSSVAAEEYRLIHAIDNDETVIRAGLTENECRKLKADLIDSETFVVEGEQEDPKLGTLACLPESAFE